MSLTKTRGKGRPQKTKLVEDLRTAVDEYQHIYVFSFENMRASIFKDIRLHFRESRYFSAISCIPILLSYFSALESKGILKTSQTEYLWERTRLHKLPSDEHLRMNSKITYAI